MPVKTFISSDFLFSLFPISLLDMVVLDGYDMMKPLRSFSEATRELPQFVHLFSLWIRKFSTSKNSWIFKLVLKTMTCFDKTEQQQRKNYTMQTRLWTTKFCKISFKTSFQIRLLSLPYWFLAQATENEIKNNQTWVFKLEIKLKTFSRAYS